jgi:hypothetical protein
MNLPCATCQKVYPGKPDNGIWVDTSIWTMAGQNLRRPNRPFRICAYESTHPDPVAGPFPSHVPQRSLRLAGSMSRSRIRAAASVRLPGFARRNHERTVVVSEPQQTGTSKNSFFLTAARKTLNPSSSVRYLNLVTQKCICRPTLRSRGSSCGRQMRWWQSTSSVRGCAGRNRLAW